MPPKPGANQQTVSQVGELKGLTRKGANPDGIYSGMTKRLVMVEKSTFDKAGAEIKSKRDERNYIPLRKTL